MSVGRGLTRRQFLQTTGAAAGSLVLGCQAPARESWPAGPAAEAGDGVFDAWLAITPDGRILVQVHKVEMGQGTYTAFATLVGEELRTDPLSIELIAAPVDAAFGAPVQGTGGSASLVEIWEPLRETAARARIMLVEAAAQRSGSDGASLVVAEGFVEDPARGERLSFGELAADAARRAAPRQVALTPPEQWRYIGKRTRRVDSAAKVTGQAEYGMDVALPGLRTAVVVHCPHVRGTLVSFDPTRANDIEGVEAVFGLESGVAIVARNYWSARSAARVLEVEWDPGESRGVDSAGIAAGLAAALDGGELHSARDEGEADEKLAAAPAVVEAEYRLPFLAHATMEPMNCTVAPREGSCDVYGGTQAPGLVQDAVAHELGLPRSAVRVHNQLLGGGFGRRFFADMASEAAQIARRVKGPIKLVWSREDDMARDFYRPASLHRLRGSLASDGAPEAWEHKLAAPSLFPSMVSMGGAVAPEWLRGVAASVATAVGGRVPRWFGPVLAIEGAKDQPYAVPNVTVEAVAWEAGIPVGIWRSVGHSHNGFVVESFVDELAHAAGRDPASYRRDLLSSHSRHLAALDLVVEQANWGEPAPGLAQGVAVHESFGTVVAQVAEVRVDGDRLHVERVVCAVDCGLAVNPDIVEAQMESAINFGLTAALYGAIHFEDGAAVESNFHDHPMLKMADAPRIEVHIVPSAAPPSGVGEPGTPPVAAAVANAIFAATGERRRELPLTPGGVLA